MCEICKCFEIEHALTERITQAKYPGYFSRCRIKASKCTEIEDVST